MDLDLPDGATLFGDRAYNHYSFEEELLGDARIRLIPQRTNRTTRPHEGVVNHLQKTHRKRVEIVNSQITRRFPRSIGARSAQGFALRFALLGWLEQTICCVQLLGKVAHLGL